MADMPLRIPSNAKGILKKTGWLLGNCLEQGVGEYVNHHLQVEQSGSEQAVCTALRYSDRDLDASPAILSDLTPYYLKKNFTFFNI